MGCLKARARRPQKVTVSRELVSYSDSTLNPAFLVGLAGKGSSFATSKTSDTARTIASAVSLGRDEL